MKLGVFSDIHGNWSALEAVWKDLQSQGLTGGLVLNAGDNVGYGKSPEQCVRFLRDHPNIASVRGNYDKNVARFPETKAEIEKKWASNRPEKYRAIARDSSAISTIAREWLLELPAELKLVRAGNQILLTHYAPSVKEGLGIWTADTRLRELAQMTQAQVVVCGHTHTPFVRDVGGVLWVNPGTVGRGAKHCADYAILTLEETLPPKAQLCQVLIS